MHPPQLTAPRYAATRTRRLRLLVLALAALLAVALGMGLAELGRLLEGSADPARRVRSIDVDPDLLIEYY